MVSRILPHARVPTILLAGRMTPSDSRALDRKDENGAEAINMKYEPKNTLLEQNKLWIKSSYTNQRTYFLKFTKARQGKGMICRWHWFRLGSDLRAQDELIKGRPGPVIDEIQDTPFHGLGVWKTQEYGQKSHRPVKNFRPRGKITRISCFSLLWKLSATGNWTQNE